MCRRWHNNKLVLEQAHSPQQLKHLTPNLAGSPSTASTLYQANITYHTLLASLSYWCSPTSVHTHTAYQREVTNNSFNVQHGPCIKTRLWICFWTLWRQWKAIPSWHFISTEQLGKFVISLSKNISCSWNSNFS